MLPAGRSGNGHFKIEVFLFGSRRFTRPLSLPQEKEVGRCETAAVSETRLGGIREKKSLANGLFHTFKPP